MMFTVHALRLHPVRVTLSTSSLRCASVYTPPALVARYTLAPPCASTCGPYTSTAAPAATVIPNRAVSAFATHTSRAHALVTTRSVAALPIESVTVVADAARTYTLKQ